MTRIFSSFTYYIASILRKKITTPKKVYSVHATRKCTIKTKRRINVTDFTTIGSSRAYMYEKKEDEKMRDRNRRRKKEQRKESIKWPSISFVFAVVLIISFSIFLCEREGTMILVSANLIPCKKFVKCTCNCVKKQIKVRDSAGYKTVCVHPLPFRRFALFCVADCIFKQLS